MCMIITTGTIVLIPAERIRKFIEPPMGCNYIELVIEDSRDIQHTITMAPVRA